VDVLLERSERAVLGIESLRLPRASGCGLQRGRNAGHVLLELWVVEREAHHTASVRGLVVSARTTAAIPRCLCSGSCSRAAVEAAIRSGMLIVSSPARYAEYLFAQRP